MVQDIFLDLRPTLVGPDRSDDPVLARGTAEGVLDGELCSLVLCDREMRLADAFQHDPLQSGIRSITAQHNLTGELVVSFSRLVEKIQEIGQHGGFFWAACAVNSDSGVIWREGRRNESRRNERQGQMIKNISGRGSPSPLITKYALLQVMGRFLET